MRDNSLHHQQLGETRTERERKQLPSDDVNYNRTFTLFNFIEHLHDPVTVPALKSYRSAASVAYNGQMKNPLLRAETVIVLLDLPSVPHLGSRTVGIRFKCSPCVPHMTLSCFSGNLGLPLPLTHLICLPKCWVRLYQWHLSYRVCSWQQSTCSLSEGSQLHHLQKRSATLEGRTRWCRDAEDCQIKLWNSILLWLDLKYETLRSTVNLCCNKWTFAWKLT